MSFYKIRYDRRCDSFNCRYYWILYDNVRSNKTENTIYNIDDYWDHNTDNN
jgi:hypothetical protein